VFKQSKTGAGVLIEWSPDPRAIVERAKKLAPQIPGDYLIRTKKGKRYSVARFSAIWQQVMAKHVKEASSSASTTCGRVSARTSDCRRSTGQARPCQRHGH
jgi:hypothetical protein